MIVKIKRSPEEFLTGVVHMQEDCHCLVVADGRQLSRCIGLSDQLHEDFIFQLNGA